jgi:uncharacterized cysteine cluster protein YcgN (CxxCxxCC family)
MVAREKFWETTPLGELTPEEWEALCDGCGKCCLHKLEDADTGDVFYTRVACELLESSSCRCRDYRQRQRLVAACMVLRPEDSADFDYLPATCAYRLRAQGEALPAWHYLVSGDPQQVHALGLSVRGRVLSAEFVHPDGFEEHIIHWVN